MQGMLGQHLITHDKHPKMEYRKRGAEEKGGIMQCGNLKLFCSELAFLTENVSSGDIIVYVVGCFPKIIRIASENAACV